MAWKPMGRPTVREQRGKWVVRVDGVDTETGKNRPRQLGTYPSKRAATTAASQFAADGEIGGDRRTLGHVVERWATSRVDVSGTTREQYQWAAGHIKNDDRDSRSRRCGAPNAGAGFAQRIRRSSPTCAPSISSPTSALASATMSSRREWIPSLL